MTRGLVALWSADTPMLRPLAIARTGVTALGRQAFPGDPLLSERHLEVSYHGTGEIQIADCSDDGMTFVDRRRPSGVFVVRPGRLIRIGDTLLVVVHRLEDYKDCAPTRRYGLDVCLSLRAACDQLARAILDETNVAIAGPRWVTHMLARGYLDARGGGLEVDITDRSRTLAAVLAEASAKTVRLESPNAVLPTEHRALRNWLETDVRFISCIRRAQDLAAVPTEIRRWLAPVVIEIPTPRDDELPRAIDAARRYYAPRIAIRATAVEEFLLGARQHDEDTMFHALAAQLARVVASRGSELVALEPTRTRRETFPMASYPIDED